MFFCFRICFLQVFEVFDVFVVVVVVVVVVVAVDGDVMSMSFSLLLFL